MAVRKNPAGPLKSTNIVQIDEALFWDKTRPPPIPARDDDEDYTIKILDRPDRLAYIKLEDSARGHIIMERNDMRLWPNDFVPGRRIAIPTVDGLVLRGLL